MIGYHPPYCWYHTVACPPFAGLPPSRFTAPSTPPERLAAALRIARERLPYVYVGNYPLQGGEDTVCPACGGTVVRRNRYRTDASGLSGTRCASCSASLRFMV